MNLLRKLAVVIVALGALQSAPVHAVPIQHKIEFTQTYFHPVFGIRDLTGAFLVDDSILGPASANKTYGIDLGPPLLTDFMISLGATIYSYDANFTAAIGLPPITNLLTLGSTGEVIDIQGGFTISGSLSQIILGRVGREGTYVDVQQVDRTNSIVASRGTYTVELVSVPEPTTLALLGLGLAGIGFAKRKKA